MGDDCENGEGTSIKHGERYHPRVDDYCLSCRCDNGTHQMCVSPSCAKPNCWKYEKVPRSCCSFICTNATSTGPATDALSTAGIRLAVSTATCVLAVVLILFLMHKLRRHRFFLSIRQGRGGNSQGHDAAVMYSSAYDGVDIDISYQPLHIPGAPPPYSPTCEELPPAYSSVPPDTSTSAITGRDGVVNTGCLTTPPDSSYSLAAQAKLSNLGVVIAMPTKDDADHSAPVSYDKIPHVERTCGVGASYTDLSLTVDISDSCNEIGEETDPHKCNPRPIKRISNPVTPPFCKTIRDERLAVLPVRLEPVGGEMSTTEALLSTPNYQRYRISKSAGSSPSALRRQPEQVSRGLTLTQYGFIDEESRPDLSDRAVVGLCEEQLMEIAANKPDRLNARVRRYNRIKRNSKQLPAEELPAEDGDENLK